MMQFDYFEGLHDKTEVPKFCFVLAVATIAVAPRLPFDKPWSVGGNLSNSFRKTLLCIVSSFVFRYVFHSSKAVRVTLMGLEGVAISFLSLLTPYLLRVWMRDLVNIPGGRQPGKALMPWIKFSLAFTMLGVIFRIFTDNAQLWIFKKVADIASFIPVSRTLRLYNSITTPQGGVQYPGRGSVLAQIVLVAEYYALFANVTDTLSKAAQLTGLIDETFLKTALMKGMYMDNLFAMYTRILCHSILLNVLDEAYNLSSASTAPASGSSYSSQATGSTSASSNALALRKTRGPMIIETVEDEENLSN